MPALELITLLANSAILVFVFYYFLKFNAREKELEKKEGKIDTQYHQVVDDALTRERKILDDATTEAEQILTDAEYISSSDKEVLEKALRKTVEDIQKEAVQTGHILINNYSSALKEIALHSQENFQDVSKEFEDNLKKQANDFQNIVKSLEEDLQKKVKEFSGSLLPSLEKELEEYKKERLRQTEKLVADITQKASIEILNKSISIEDHQKLITESLEKAKKEGIFN